MPHLGGLMESVSTVDRVYVAEFDVMSSCGALGARQMTTQQN